MALKQIALGIAAITLLTPTEAKAGGLFADRVLAPQFYHRLAKCETGKKWKHETKSYTSGFGIARGVWQRWSNSSSANRYTAEQQAEVVDKIAFLGHMEQGKYVHPVGPWGWGVVKSNCMNLQAFICKSKRVEVARWKRGC
jgi:hypothetical protein